MLCCGCIVLIQRELKAKKEEFDRWKNVPEWKKRLILDKEKKKQQEMVQQLLNFHLYSIVNFRNIYAVKTEARLTQRNCVMLRTIRKYRCT